MIAAPASWFPCDRCGLMSAQGCPCSSPIETARLDRLARARYREAVERGRVSDAKARIRRRRAA